MHVTARDNVSDISTSYCSSIVLAGLAAAHDIVATTIGFTDGDDHDLSAWWDTCLMAPATATPGLNRLNMLVYDKVESRVFAADGIGRPCPRRLPLTRRAVIHKRSDPLPDSERCGCRG